MSIEGKIENLLEHNKMPGLAYWMKRSLWHCIDETGAVIHHLHPSYKLARVRVNPKGQPFTSISDLSYPPQGVSGQGRANPKGVSLFYGSSCERRKLLPSSKWEQVTDETYGLSIALYETLFELRKNAFTSSEPQVSGAGEEKTFLISDYINIEETEVSIGLWQVVETINLVRAGPLGLYDHDRFSQYQSEQILLNTANDPEKKLDNLKFWKFLGAEFSKLGLKESDPVDYRISAFAAEKFIDDGYDGVSFPSVRSGGWGINFAISPRMVDSKLECFKVGHASIKAKDGKLIIKELGYNQLKPELAPRRLTAGEHALADMLNNFEKGMG